MSNLQTATQSYRINQIKSASPLDLVIMAYDAALIGCGQQDLERTAKALSVLRNALDFSYDADIAMGFFRLYQYCADLARKGEYDEVANLLRELRDAWVQVREQQEPAVQVNSSYQKQSTSSSYTQNTMSARVMVAG